jgi:hypothetical protein
MTVLVLRIALAPLLVGGSTLAAKKWGASVGGWLLGLPLLSGPISMIMLAERGSDFAQSAARGTLFGLAAAAAFCAAYAAASRRLSWWGSLLVGYGAFATAAGLFSLMHLSLGGTLLVVTAVLGVLVLATGRPGEARPAPEPPKWDMPVRMAITSLLVVTVSLAAGYLGAAAAGMLAPLPVLGAIMAAFTHRRCGAGAARRLLHGAVVGTWGAVAFFTVVVLLLGSGSPVAVYAVALLAAALTGTIAVRVSTGEDLRLRRIATRRYQRTEPVGCADALLSVARSSWGAGSGPGRNGPTLSQWLGRLTRARGTPLSSAPA